MYILPFESSPFVSLLLRFIAIQTSLVAVRRVCSWRSSTEHVRKLFMLLRWIHLSNWRCQILSGICSEVTNCHQPCHHQITHHTEWLVTYCTSIKHYIIQTFFSTSPIHIISCSRFTTSFSLSERTCVNLCINKSLVQAFRSCPSSDVSPPAVLPTLVCTFSPLNSRSAGLANAYMDSQNLVLW